MQHVRDKVYALLLLLLCLLPVVLLGLVVTGTVAIHPGFVLVAFLLCFVAMYWAVRMIFQSSPSEIIEKTRETMASPHAAPHIDVDEAVRRADGLLAPTASYRSGEQLVIEGELHRAPDEAYEELQRRFAGTELVPLLQETEDGRPALVLAPKSKLPEPAQTSQRTWVNAALLLATLATTTWAGALHEGVNLLEEPGRMMAGFPYALALMLILGAHELGHYFTARRYGIDVSLPYFIPVPFALGTFGAFIKMKSLSPTRRAAFDVAVAGPLAGLVIAIPALLVGLQYSEVVATGQAPPTMMGGADVGSSLLFALLAKLALGDAVLEGHRLVLHPVAFAGWLGLLVTALNLMPVGQLDGGHMAHALLGRQRAYSAGVATLVALAVLGLFVWGGLLFWALIIYFIAGTRDAPPLNDVSRLDRGRVVLGALAFALLLAILLPVPPSLYAPFGIHSPYL
jgi:membrane-associated protease RseP (regulator of RpoE activity)